MPGGLKFYRIPKGYVLYRGDTYMPPANKLESYQLADGPCFFGLDGKLVEEYGMAYEFKTTKMVEVLHLCAF
jgi:hypothetical protein